jgi:hypothetical protein
MLFANDMRRRHQAQDLDHSPAEACHLETNRRYSNVDEIAYFERRLDASKTLAARAETEGARSAHLTLAQFYREKLIALAAADTETG